MGFDMDELNLTVASKVADFVKGRLLQNKVHLDNSGEGISTEEVLQQLSVLRKDSSYGYPIEYTKQYSELAKSCAGSINFTYEEIDEIAELIEKSVLTCGVGTNVTYWDALTFASRRLEKFASSKVERFGANAKDDEDYKKAVAYKYCLQLDQMPLYYKPFACIIACGYPYSVIRIANDSNKTIYDVSNRGEVRVDNLLEDMFLDDVSVVMENDDEKGEEAISVAVDWWAQAITDPTFVLRYDPHASYLSSVLALASNMRKVAPDESSMDAFKECLSDEIRSALVHDGHYKMKVNYSLDPALNNALAKAKLRAVDYTWDTCMEISPLEVSVSFGRGDKQVIFDGKKNEDTKGFQKTIGTRESSK